MGKLMGFDRVYLDEVITVTSPADPSWIEELRREYRSGSEDDTAWKLWEWFDETNPSLGRRSRGAMSDLIDKATAEAKGEPWRVRNVGRTVVDGCVLPDRPDPILSSALREITRQLYGHTDVPPCLAGPKRSEQPDTPKG